MPCILNAANEIAVESFLEEKTSYLEMSDILEYAMSKVSFIKSPSLNDYLETDTETRKIATELINN